MNREEYYQLIEKIREYDFRYYIECDPLISDYEYDQLYKKLEDIETKHPDWVLPSSPTQTIKDSINKGFKQKSHKYPMYSLANTYSEEELDAFVTRMQKHLEKTDVAFCCELKMDGLALSLTYEKGHFVKAITRGNGKVGDDITANVKSIKTLPMNLKGSNHPNFMEVRCEVYMPIAVFQKLNQEKEEAGEDVWANPRNAAAGSLKLLDPKEVYRRNLAFFAYGIEGVNDLDTQYNVHKLLKTWGFPVFGEKHFYLAYNAADILSFADKVQNMRLKLPYEIDGIVIKLDDVKAREYIGYTSKVPRWAVAYKFAPEQAETMIENITVQVGRTGVLTPVAQLKPVFLSGSNISRATLHNQDEISRKDIRVGDSVIIEKGGDVIPKVVHVIFDKRSKDAKTWTMPTHCPSCNKPVQHVGSEIAIRCLNHQYCPAQNLQRIISFVSKKAMDIEHFGSRNVERFIEEGLITSVTDIYRITKEQLLPLEGFKEKSVDNLMKSIKASKNVSLNRFILALGIPYVGETAAELLANHFKTIDRLANADIDELTQIDGIGPKMASSIIEFFNSSYHKQEIDEFISLGIDLQKPASVATSDHAFSSKIFVLTGSLDNYTRSQASKLIKDRGGKVSSSVSKKTDFVLAGQDPGSKYEKAKKLGISILSEQEFKSML